MDRNNVVPFTPLDDDGPDAADQLVRVSPGVYTVVYERHQGFRIFGRPHTPTHKVRIDFRLTEHPELIVPRWYRVKSFRPWISAGPSSDIVRELCVVLSRRVKRLDRIPVSLLQGILATAIVKDVVTDHRQHELAAINRYSVIERLVGRAD
jgi:hypothetical protein